MFGLSFAALALIWFLLLGVLLAGYALLDGFDLGVGMVHSFAARNDRERRLVHGAIFLYLKTEGDLQKRLTPLMWRSFDFFLVAFLLCTIYTLFAVPRATRIFEHRPWLWIVPMLNVLAVTNIPPRDLPGQAGRCVSLVVLGDHRVCDGTDIS